MDPPNPALIGAPLLRTGREAVVWGTAVVHGRCSANRSGLSIQTLQIPTVTITPQQMRDPVRRLPNRRGKRGQQSLHRHAQR